MANIACTLGHLLRVVAVVPLSTRLFGTGCGKPSAANNELFRNGDGCREASIFSNANFAIKCSLTAFCSRCEIPFTEMATQSLSLHRVVIDVAAIWELDVRLLGCTVHLDKHPRLFHPAAIYCC